MTDYVTPADIVKLTLAATALEDVAAWRKRLNKPAAAQHTWTANDKTCSTEEAAVEKLVLCTHDFVDDAMLLSLEDPVHGLTTVSLQEIVAHIGRTYGTLTSTQFSALKLYFQRPMRTGATIEEAIAEHEMFAQVAITAGMPLSEHDRVHSLLAAVSGNSVFAFGISTWQHANPEMAQQSFANLRVALLTASRTAIVLDPSLGLSAMSSNRHAFSAQAVDGPVVPVPLSLVSPSPALAVSRSRWRPRRSSQWRRPHCHLRCLLLVSRQLRPFRRRLRPQRRGRAFSSGRHEEKPHGRCQRRLEGCQESYS